LEHAAGLEAVPMVIKKVNPLSCAKVAAVIYAGIGLIIGGMFSLLAMAGGFASETSRGGLFGMLVGAGAIIVAPIIYACMGFLGTLIAAVIFNIAVGIVGGVEIEVA
jgi:hypothetical protein